MNDVTCFLALITALSAGVQTLIDNVKGHWKWLDTPIVDNEGNESWRRTVIHILSASIGFGLSLSVHLQPLKCLNAGRGAENVWLNALVGALMVTFGSSFSNEALDAVRAFKKVQEGLRQNQPVGNGVPPRFVS